MGIKSDDVPAVEAHVMVIPFPAQGHMNPMMQFANRLAAKGLQVTLFAPTSIITSMEDQSSSVNLDYISYKFDEGEKPDGAGTYLAHVKRRVSENLPGLIQKYISSTDCPAKVLVYDSHMPWAGDIGHQLGVKIASFFTQAVASSAIYYHVHKGSLKVPVEGPTVSLPALPVLEIEDLPSAIFDGLYPAALDLHASQFSNLDKADWILFNTFDELESEVLNWLASKFLVVTIGPTIPSMYLDKQIPNDKDYGLSLFKPDAERCIKWLDTKDPGSVVYVSFGSFANLSQVHMDELVWGLLNSNNNFLWVVRDSEKSKLPSNFLADSAEKGLVVGWCPQIEVLGHKAVGSFMTHCGWNSSLEALSLGVPMLAMPQWSDQTINAKYVEDVWRTGVRVKSNFTKEEIAKCINDVMQGAKGEEIRENARKWKELAVKAMEKGGSSDKNIHKFISNVLPA